MTTDVLDQRGAHGEIHGHPDTFANAAFGFWIYLMSDCILFAALFATFVVLSHNYAGGPDGRDLFDLPYTLGETAFLLCSSLTSGFAILGMQKRHRNAVALWLVVTFLLGSGFIGMEINEFYRMIAAGNGPVESGFLSAFFTLVGTHGAHVTAGLVWILVMLSQLATKGLTDAVQSRLLRFSLFWHFLDIVWICVFSTVYLKGVM